MSEPLVIWRLTDGKPGHMQQTLGLIQALSRLRPCECIDIDLRGDPVGLRDVVLRRFPPGVARKRPALVIGAGHRTHLALLAARRTTGAKTIALMKPSLPVAWFDLVIAPEHDGLTEGPRVINSIGVLNPMQEGSKVQGSVLVLVGGPSKHVKWDDAAMLAQIADVVAAQPPSAIWQITDSRRTPPTVSAMLSQRYGGRFQPHASCPPGWLASQLRQTDTVWVSEDSVSMVYESLTAGCRVALLQLEADRDSRVARGVARLLEQGLATSFERWKQDGLLPAPTRFNEAGRIAPLVLERLGLS